MIDNGYMVDLNSLTTYVKTPTSLLKEFGIPTATFLSALLGWRDFLKKRHKLPKDRSFFMKELHIEDVTAIAPKSQRRYIEKLTAKGVLFVEKRYSKKFFKIDDVVLGAIMHPEDFEQEHRMEVQGLNSTGYSAGMTPENTDGSIIKGSINSTIPGKRQDCETRPDKTARPVGTSIISNSDKDSFVPKKSFSDSESQPRKSAAPALQGGVTLLKEQIDNALPIQEEEHIDQTPKQPVFVPQKVKPFVDVWEQHGNRIHGRYTKAMDKGVQHLKKAITGHLFQNVTGYENYKITIEDFDKALRRFNTAKQEDFYPKEKDKMPLNLSDFLLHYRDVKYSPFITYLENPPKPKQRKIPQVNEGLTGRLQLDYGDLVLRIQDYEPSTGADLKHFADASNNLARYYERANIAISVFELPKLLIECLRKVLRKDSIIMPHHLSNPKSMDTLAQHLANNALAQPVKEKKPEYTPEESKEIKDTNDVIHFQWDLERKEKMGEDWPAWDEKLLKEKRKDLEERGLI